nr:alpha-galactosidase [Spirochaeta isovalerica]
MRILPTGHPAHLYYGEKISHKESLENFLYLPSETLGYGNSTSYSTGFSGFSLNHLPLEYSSYGKGDYRNPSIALCGEDGNRTFDFTFVGYKINSGKTIPDGLPASFPDENETVETLVIELSDQSLNLTLLLSYSIFESKDIITRTVEIRNNSKSPVTIDKISSFSLDFDHKDFDLITFDGAWIRERHPHRRALGHGLTEISSRKGISSPDHNPFLVLCDKKTTEHHGDAYGFALMYSGNHSSSVEVSSHNSTRVQTGINHFDFSWLLEPGAAFQTPEAVMTFSAEGLNGMSGNFHRFIRHNIVRGTWKHKERPVLINNWEATYFDFNEKKLLNLAKEAKSLGVELFVLDDGWFGERNDDRTSLGDWFVNKKKLPSGIEGLAEKINKLGMNFGIWVEPEMISEKSDLYEKHPDWMVRTPHRDPSPGRNQFLLDLSNVLVCDFLYEILSDLFRKAGISYVKWDMNRSFSDVYSPALSPERQKEFSHRYVLGLYSLLERLTNEFPHILFESCASGGSRFDLAMFYYMPQIWTSDDTDAMERLPIQYGSSMLAPLSVMGAHVSAVPNHQVLRNTPLETRFNTATFGLLGYELDLTKLNNFEKKVIKKQISFYKEYRKLLQFGDFYRIEDPLSGEMTLWMVVSSDKNEAIIGYYQKTAKPNPGPERYRLKGLDPHKKYSLKNRTQFMDVKQFGHLINMVSPVELKENGVLHQMVASNYLYEVEKTEFSAYGDQLMNRGFCPAHQFYGTGLDEKIAFLGDFGSRLFLLKALDK